MFSLVFLLKGSFPLRRSRAAGLVLASDFQRTSASASHHVPYPSFLGEADCKGTAIFIIGNQKFQLFLIIFDIILITR